MDDNGSPDPDPNPNPNPNSSSSAETVANDDDLLNEILLRMPIKSLLQLKSVSKHWLSLITHPHFVLRRSRTTPISEPSGLFLQSYADPFPSEFHFIPLKLNDDENPTKPPFRIRTRITPLAFAKDPTGIRILQSCNGLLLCGGFNFYVYNPTTNQFTTLPTRRISKTLQAVNLAFDPSKSPHYKVVSVYSSNSSSEPYELVIFSSETGLWSPSSNPFSTRVDFNNGVFWNGALHWTEPSGANSLYFNIEEERFGTMPMPPIPDGHCLQDRRFKYFGVSRDHLYLIEIYGLRTRHFNVYEMQRDYSVWFMKYRVNLDANLIMCTLGGYAFPEIICSSLGPADLHYYEFVVLSLVRGENDEEGSFLVLHIPGKIIRYNFRDKSFSKLFDVPPSHHDTNRGLRFGGRFNAFEYIESLAYV